MKTRTVYFLVIGSGEFPYDMLRHDGCYPATESGSNNLRPGRNGLRHLYLMTTNRPRDWLPTYDRWKSRGWRVADITETLPQDVATELPYDG
jgi:hypothetical protein